MESTKISADFAAEINLKQKPNPDNQYSQMLLAAFSI